MFKEDFSGFYLSLNMGVTEIRKLYGVKTDIALKARSGNYLAKLGTLSNDYLTGDIDLEPSDKTNLSFDYQYGSVCAKYYPLGEVPSDKVLLQDLREFLVIYNKLVSLSDQENEYSNEIEDDEVFLALDGRKIIRVHKKIERNKKLAQEAKKHHGYACKACGFDFEEKYGEIGKSFIEAHHLTPLSKISTDGVMLNPKTDFTVLCSNCHRMIHKTEYVDDVAKFVLNYIVKN